MKNEFLTKLETLLSRVPEDDRKDMLYDYEEHFEVGLANGKSEKELTIELGDPYVIARDLLADYRTSKIEKELTKSEEEDLEDLKNSIVKKEQKRYQETKVKKSYQETKVAGNSSSSNVSRAVLAGIGVTLFNLIFIVGPAAGIFAVYVSLCAVALALTLSPIALISSSILGFSYESFAVNFFVSLTLLSLGLLMGIGMFYVGKFLGRLAIKYIKINSRIITGGKAA